MFSFLAEMLQWIKAALFPSKCLVCFREGALLCKQHPIDLKPQRLRLDSNSSLDACYAVSDYRDLASASLVKALKFKRQKQSVPFMITALSSGIPFSKFNTYQVVPLPLHYWRQHWRGFNQSELIARSLALQLGLSLNLGLKRSKATLQQASLNQSERSKNMQGAFSWDSKYAVPAKVILMDDVYTTGSTMEAAAKSLKRAGVLIVVGVVFSYQSDEK